MANDLYALLAVTLVGMAAVGTLVSPTGAIVGMHCEQVITPLGMGRMICTEGESKPSGTTAFLRRGTQVPFVPSEEQTHAKFAQRYRLTAEDTQAPRYQAPVTITGGTERMFSGEDYLNRRRLQREREGY